jgi:hypothetical protein
VVPIQWEVKYTSGEIETGTDNLSRKAFNNSDLVRFRLFYAGKIYEVDLKRGTISLNGYKIYSNLGEQLYRLIYYRKVTGSIGTNSNPSIESDIPHIGWQTTINGKNHKVIFGLYVDATVAITG